MGVYPNEIKRDCKMNAETKLQNEILVALSQNGCYADRYQVGNFYTAYGGRVSVGKKGQSDIRGHREQDGKAFYIEVKCPGQSPTIAQINFLAAMKRTNALAGIAYSVDDALRIVGIQ